MTTPARFGKKVLFYPLERVDLPDLDAVGVLPIETLSRVAMSLRGDIDATATGDGNLRFTAQNGLLSALNYSAVGPVVTFGPMRLGRAVEAPEGHVAIEYYDPADPNTTAGLDFSDYEGLSPFVWARFAPYAGDEASRRFWVEASTSEDEAIVATRQKPAVVLGLSLLTSPFYPEIPPKGTGWFRIARAKVVPGGGGDVELEPRFMFDRYDPLLEESSSTVAVGKRAKFYAEDRASAKPGLEEITTAVFAALSKITDGRWKFDPETFLLDGAAGDLLGDLKGWRDLFAETNIVGLEQLNGLSNLPDNIIRILAGRTASRSQILGKVLFDGSVDPAFSLTYENTHLQLSATRYTSGPTDHGGDGVWWYVEAAAFTHLHPTPGEWDSRPEDVVTANVWQNVVITNVTVQPRHPVVGVWTADNTWAALADSRIADLSVNMGLPIEVTPVTPLKVKVRFRSTANNFPVLTPEDGWVMTFWGHPVITL